MKSITFNGQAYKLGDRTCGFVDKSCLYGPQHLADVTFEDKRIFDLDFFTNNPEDLPAKGELIILELVDPAHEAYGQNWVPGQWRVVGMKT